MTCPRINMRKTGEHLRQLFNDHGYTVRDIQEALCIGSNQAIYSWLVGRTLPSLDNLVALSILLEISIDEILILDE